MKVKLRRKKLIPESMKLGIFSFFQFRWVKKSNSCKIRNFSYLQWAKKCDGGFLAFKETKKNDNSFSWMITHMECKWIFLRYKFVTNLKIPNNLYWILLEKLKSIFVAFLKKKKFQKRKTVLRFLHYPNKFLVGILKYLYFYFVNNYKMYRFQCVPTFGWS